MSESRPKSTPPRGGTGTPKTLRKLLPEEHDARRGRTPQSYQESDTMTVREQETLLRALDLWRKAVGEMTWEGRAEAALALLIVRDDEIEALRRRIQGGKIQ